MKLPHIGYRNMKTGIAACLCALLYVPFNRNPVFACIGAIFGMGADMENSKLLGGNRLFGTVLGGLIGMALYALYLLLAPEGNYLLLVLLLYIGVIVLILVSTKLWKGAVQAGGVVLCIVLFNSTPDGFVLYAINRILDTAIGVGVALAVNQLLTRDRMDTVKYAFLKPFGIQRPEE
ncbi:MAG: FUSC family protein [Oscillospiraceae bacterium]|nr:FUSC family protein [Oscillospiraceae bacterium]